MYAKAIKKIKIKDKKLPDLVLADYRLILLFLLASFEMLGTLGFLAKLLHSQLVYHRLFSPDFWVNLLIIRCCG